MAPTSLLFLIVLATISSVNSGSVPSNRSCIPAERAALLSFKAGIIADPANRLASWQPGHHDCCRWTGVTCSSRTGHVIKLDLRSGFPPRGEPHGPDEQHSLRGQVSSSLLGLRHSLRHLDLSGNIVLGGAMAMPGFLGSLHSLRYLNLSYMDFRGEVPPQLGNLSELIQLDIHGNVFYPLMYSDDISWLARVRSLEHLDMGWVNLTRADEWVHTVNTLPNLIVLILQACELNAPSSLLHLNLTVLEELDLSFNYFNSLAAPNWFWDITSLRRLSLWGCGLLGTFPDELGNLTLLQTFDISLNNLKGMIPGTMQNMCNLRSLSLSDNNIGGDITEVMYRIPNCSWNNLQELRLSEANITGADLHFMLNLTSLSILDVSRNQISGSVPLEIGTLTSLSYLNLQINNLSGLVPLEIGTLTHLTELYLGYNNLSGVVSEDHFVGLINLKIMDLSYNNLEFTSDSNWVPPFNLDMAYFSSCHLGPQIPKWLRWQKSITGLDISNTSIVGRIPSWFWTTFSHATYLDLSLNQFSGELPLSLEFMSVMILLMHSNLLTGLIPKLPRTTKVFDISRNSLNGFVPNFQAPHLMIAAMFSNSITGTIPTSICGLRELRVLDLSNNLLSVELPDCGREDLKQWNPFGNNSSRVNSGSSFSLGIITLLLSNNSLSSGFPLFLQQCPNITFLDLSQNKFIGELPGWISKAMPSLVMLRIRSNKFSGHIPNEIMELHDVRILDLSNNNFSGAIPQNMENLKALTVTATTDYTIFGNPFGEIYSFRNDLSYRPRMYNDSFSVVIKGQVLKYRENTQYLMSIDLSCNSLTREIPEKLSSLVGLINLNLASNFLSGDTPYKIGNLRSLESLDFSNNKLCGGIPQGLADLTYLSYLNLSYNNLSGRIPSGYQLDSLKTDDPASMYNGNPGLCGHPLPRQCPSPPNDSPTNEDSARWHEDDLSEMDFLLGLIIGFLAGAWMLFCGLLFMKRWRYAYFRLLDKLYDRFYVFSVVTWRKWFRDMGVN